MESLPEWFTEQECPDLRGGPLVVGVSGGLDSMALLHLLHLKFRHSKVRLVVAHLNHRLRGRESMADERLVKSQCARMKVRFVSARAEVAQIAKRRKISLEVAARQARHDFLARVAKRMGASVVALAHHRDDQVELFLMRLLRGASPGGLGGMSETAPSPANSNVTLWRPLLKLDRAVLAAYAEATGIRWREDRSNADPTFLRNRIRHSLVPLIRRDFQPALNSVVERTMVALRDAAEFAREAAQRWLAGKRRVSLMRLPAAVQRVVVELELIRLGIEPSFDLIETLRTEPGTPVSVGTGVTAVWERNNGQLMLRRSVLKDFKPDRRDVRLDLKRNGQTGRVRFHSGELRHAVVKPPQLDALNFRRGSEEFFDADKIGPGFALRHWRPGDRFQPIGMKQPAKLQDLFVNAKIPRQQRRDLVVAEAANGILFWVENLRISELFKLDTNTRRALKWLWQR